jgi:hypothetical protein
VNWNAPNFNKTMLHHHVLHCPAWHAASHLPLKSGPITKHLSQPHTNSNSSPYFCPTSLHKQMYKAELTFVLGLPSLHTALGVAQYASASCLVVHGFAVRN